ncbi:DUF4345 domain-containing protein [Nocardia jejuensis]|uniref:DUF4345 domain-containing protein n=1 Tax=Nocardia jejuensis TaxID=328049 RepID=UPI000834114C|nr:DUF4345 domain-containing protein [Nocardia jejuensis]
MTRPDVEASPNALPDILIRVYLTLATIAFAALGLKGIIVPGPAVSAVGLHAEAVTGLNEARATYGGLHLAFAAVFALGLHRSAVRIPALCLGAVVCGGLAFGRVVSLFADGWPNTTMLGWLTLEIAATLIAAWSLRKISRRG